MLCSSEKKIVDANNVDVLQKTTMVRSKMSTVVDKTRPNARGDNMVGNYKCGHGASGKSQPTPSLLFDGILFLAVEATNSLPDTDS